MRAIVNDQYGPPSVLQLREVPTPTPAPDELLVAVRATTVTVADVRQRALRVPRGLGLLSRLALGLFAPRRKVLGGELAGVVVAVGAKVTRFAVGTPVFAMSEDYAGCHAELRTLRESAAIAVKPDSLSFERAAALSFGGTTALDFFRRAKLRPGERLLVNGASGAVGSAAVQLGKHLGAHVTAVCSAANVALVKNLGADEVIDYTRQDFARDGARYDVIMDTVGNAPWSRVRGALAPRGRLAAVLATLSEMLGALWVNLTRKQKVVVGTAKVRAEDLRLLAELAARGIYEPVIDSVYPLERIADAHTRVDGGHKRGNVVVQVSTGLAQVERRAA